MKLILGIFFVMVIMSTGCAVNTQSLRIDSVTRAPKPPAEVQILLDPPTAPYLSIGIVTAADGGWGLPLEHIKARLVEEAAAMGGDAVILSREASNSDAGVMAGGLGVLAGGPDKLVGKVIVYKAGTPISAGSQATAH